MARLRALPPGDRQWQLPGARAAASELKHVGLAEALELTLLILAKEPMRFRAAALRWHARYCGDNKVSIEEATAMLGLLSNAQRFFHPFSGGRVHGSTAMKSS